MAILELARLSYGGQILVDAVAIGSYEFRDDRLGVIRTLPVWDVSQIIVRDRNALVKDRRTAGVVRGRILNEGFARSGRVLEYHDNQATKLAIYNTTLADRLALRAVKPSGLPTHYGLHWSRFVRGPMSPTLEQEDTSANSTEAGSTLDLTVISPTSGNLLIVVAGYYYMDASAHTPTISGFTRRVTAGNGNFEVNQSILDKISAGTEGTITVEFTTVQENSGWVGEYSGMESAPYVTSGSTDPGVSDVTSRSSGTADTDTPNKANCLLVAGFGLEQTNSPATFSYTNSFTEEASIGGVQGATDHLTKVATRVVSAESATYSTTASWTNAVECAGVIAAYEYTTNSAPTIMVPAATQYAAIGVAYDIGSLLTGADTDGNVDELRLRCTEALGDIGVTLSGGVTVTAGNNNSHDMTLGGTQAALLTVLATATYTATAAGSATITVDITDDAAATDQDTFTVRSAKIVVIGSTQAILNGALNTFTVTNAVEENVNLTVIGIDDAGLEDSASSVLTFEFVPASGSSGGPVPSLTQLKDITSLV